VSKIHIYIFLKMYLLKHYMIKKQCIRPYTISILFGIIIFIPAVVQSFLFNSAVGISVVIVVQAFLE
jgi:hypothetical protein